MLSFRKHWKVASEGWYRGFLHRHNFLTGAERPLEIKRHKWLTLGNLETCFDVCAKVFVKAGAARVNPDYVPRHSKENMQWKQSKAPWQLKNILTFQKFSNNTYLKP
jgi:hypothetical protein